MTKASVQIAVDDGGGTICPGSVKRLSARAALGIFRQDTCPPLEVGRRVHLMLSSSSTQELLSTEATVHQVSEHAPFEVVVFRFLEEQPGIRALIDTRAQEDRRTADRLAPDALVQVATLGVPRDVVPLLPGIPGSAIRQNEEIHLHGRVSDLSVHGAALSVEREAEIAFVASDRVLVSLTLNAQDAPLVIAGRIRHRQDCGRRLLYGIAFDWDRTEDRWARQELLAQHLSKEAARPDGHASAEPAADPGRSSSHMPAEPDPVEPLSPSAAASTQQPPAAG